LYEKENISTTAEISSAPNTAPSTAPSIYSETLNETSNPPSSMPSKAESTKEVSNKDKDAKLPKETKVDKADNKGKETSQTKTKPKVDSNSTIAKTYKKKGAEKNVTNNTTDGSTAIEGEDKAPGIPQPAALVPPPMLIQYTVDGIKMTLNGGGEMNEAMLKSFEAIMKEYYEDFFKKQMAVRRLKAEPAPQFNENGEDTSIPDIHNFTTQVLVTDQEITSTVSNGMTHPINSIIYSQFVNLSASYFSEEQYASMIQLPFVISNDEGRSLLDLLQTKNLAFSTVQLPLYPTFLILTTHSTNQPSSLWIAFMCAGIVGVAVSTLVACKIRSYINSSNKGKQGRAGSASSPINIIHVDNQDKNDGDQDEDDQTPMFPPFEDLEASDTPSVSSLGNVSEIGARSTMTQSEQWGMSVLEFDDAVKSGTSVAQRSAKKN
jgi:hypothetical protein